jgi:hypothetical protein
LICAPNWRGSTETWIIMAAAIIGAFGILASRLPEIITAWRG